MVSEFGCIDKKYFQSLGVSINAFSIFGASVNAELEVRATENYNFIILVVSVNVFLAFGHFDKCILRSQRHR